MAADDHEESELLSKGPCPNKDCGSSDACAAYTDGHSYCFSCGAYFHGDGERAEAPEASSKVSGLIPMDELEVSPLPRRKLTEDTCAKWGYYLGMFAGEKVHVACYRDANNRVVAQKVRTAGKDFIYLGDIKAALPLYGQHLWRNGGKRVVVTEGELDALSVSQVQNNRWPVVSIPTGAKGAKKSVAKAIEWLEKFDEVVFMFDMDEPGQAAVQECVSILSAGKAKVASLPLKDASDMLKAGRSGELIDAMWGAKEYRPDGVVSVMDVYEDAVRMPTMGLPWPWPSLTELTYGINRKSIYALGAGVGIGKTDWAKELESHIVNKLRLPVGVFMLEEAVGRTLKGIAGKFHGVPFHDPKADFTQEQLRAAIKELDGKVYLYDHKGVKDWDTIKSAILFMVASLNIKDIFLDNFTALTSHLSSSEANDELNRIAGDLAGMVHKHDFTIYGFSHLNPPRNGVPHEQGGKVHESQFTGSRALMKFAHYMFGLQRNKDPELPEEERNLTTFVLLKDREYGNVGKFYIYFDKKSGTYLEPSEEFLAELERAKREAADDGQHHPDYQGGPKDF